VVWALFWYFEGAEAGAWPDEGVWGCLPGILGFLDWGAIKSLQSPREGTAAVGYYILFVQSALYCRRN
jgi:hypothetical protein